MKKITSLFILIFLVVSCSSDSSSSDSDAILVKKIVRSNDNSTAIYTTNYIYSGRKFSEINSSDYTRKFHYSGDLITKIEFYYGNQLNSVSDFTYDSSGKLIQSKNEIVTGGNLGQILRDTYVYNSDHTISVSHYSNIDNGFDPVIGEHLDSTSKYFMDANDEVAKIEDYYTGGTGITTFTYDDKHHPFKNVIGRNKLLESFTGINFNTVTVGYSGYNEGSFQDQVKEITYNANDYPMTIHIQNESTTEHYYY